MAYFNLRVTPAPELKVIISISKKVSKKAVVRNRIRRRIRPMLRKFKLKPAQYLFMAKPGAENIKGEELILEFRRLLKV